jgi:hypothetical protein
MDLSPRPRSRLLFLFVSLFALGYNLSGNLPEYHVLKTPRTPVDVQEIQAKCNAIKSFPGPTPFFLKREASDRFEAGTNSTLITNATILIGKGNDTRTLHGDLYLDKGIVKAIGSLFRPAVENAFNLTVVDANGAWVTPGLGISFCLFLQLHFRFMHICTVDLHTHMGLVSAPFMAGKLFQ